MKINPSQGLSPDILDLLSQKEQISQSAKDLESLFINQMLKTMRNSIEKSGFMDGKNAENLYQSMLDSEYAKIMADNDHMGLSKQIESQLLGIADPNKKLQDPELVKALEAVNLNEIKRLGKMEYEQRFQK